MSQAIYFNSKQQITWFPRQSNPLESNGLFHPSPPHFCALLGGFLCTAGRIPLHCWEDSSALLGGFLCTAGRIPLGTPQLPGYGPLDGLHPSKRVPLMIPLSLGKEKKSHGARSGEQGGCCSTAMCFSARNCRMLRAL